MLVLFSYCVRFLVGRIGKGKNKSTIETKRKRKKKKKKNMKWEREPNKHSNCCYSATYPRMRVSKNKIEGKNRSEIFGGWAISELLRKRNDMKILCRVACVSVFFLFLFYTFKYIPFHLWVWKNSIFEWNKRCNGCLVSQCFFRQNTLFHILFFFFSFVCSLLASRK